MTSIRRGLEILLGWALLLYAAPARASGPAFEAVHTSEPPHVDGRLDEASWLAAPVFSGFHQSLPRPGVPPSERTEVRVLHDGAHLYVGVRCFDHQPHLINAQLGRRDNPPPSDRVWVMIDSLHDRLSGTAFMLNAGGTLWDARILQDTELDAAWDGAWEGAAARDEQGWSAELRIPFRLLRFAEQQEQRWGFHVRREIARTHEQLDSVPLPPEVNALVSRFTELRARHRFERPRSLDLLPYVATRLGREPQPTGPRLLVPTVDVGLDARADLTSRMALVLTLNPEFGQVEADEFIVNRTRLETLLTEKRPFFLEGLEPFQPVDESFGEQTLFYSRRIGQELPLLAAVKLSGTVHEGVQVGVLDALEAGVADPRPEEPFALRFHPWRPLHLAPNVSLPDQVLPPNHVFAGAARFQLSGSHTLGAATALSTPLSSRCPSGASEPEEDCFPSGGRAVAMDASLRSPSGDYTLAAQVTGSQVTGGPPEGILRGEGTLLKAGDTGLGFQLTGGKQGGKPWLLGVFYRHASPRLELNPTGFQLVSNEQLLVLTPTYLRTEWAGLVSASVGLQSQMSWSTDARRLPLGTGLELFGSATWQDLTTMDCNLRVEVGRKDLYAIWQAGVAYQRPSRSSAECAFSSDPNRPLTLSVQATVGRLHEGPESVRRIAPGLLFLSGTWKPLPRFQTELFTTYESELEAARWLEMTEEDLHLFGDADLRSIILGLRQLVVLSPPLTFQVFAQLRGDLGRYDRFYEAHTERGDLLRLADLHPASAEQLTTSSADFSLQGVVRWEYAPGSTLFVVYLRTQQALPTEDSQARLSLLPRSLLGGPHTDSLLVKLNYLW